MSRPPEGAAPAEPPTYYEIRVSGVLDPRWAAWFEGLQVASDDHGETTITGPVADQAALHGLLARSATWACRCSRSAASTQTANPHGGSDATASRP